jgi:pyruvate kinase
LEQLIRAGRDVARINASHCDHASHTRRIKAVRQVAKQVGGTSGHSAGFRGA